MKAHLQHANYIANSIYGQAPKLKMNKKDFTKKLSGSFCAGQMDAYVQILQLIANEDFEKKDEVIGDIHLMLRECWNEFAIGAGRGKALPMPDIEHILSGSTEGLLINKK